MDQDRIHKRLKALGKKYDKSFKTVPERLEEIREEKKMSLRKFYISIKFRKSEFKKYLSQGISSISVLESLALRLNKLPLVFARKDIINFGRDDLSCIWNSYITEVIRSETRFRNKKLSLSKYSLGTLSGIYSGNTFPSMPLLEKIALDLEIIPLYLYNKD